jgi:hypothetical protein
LELGYLTNTKVGGQALLVGMFDTSDEREPTPIASNFGGDTISIKAAQEAKAQQPSAPSSSATVTASTHSRHGQSLSTFSTGCIPGYQTLPYVAQPQFQPLGFPLLLTEQGRGANYAVQPASPERQEQGSYASSSADASINLSRGYVQLESRGVFVNHLNYGARSQDVERLFGDAGKIVKCEIRKDRRTGKNKGAATLLFTSQAEAQRAVEMFDGHWFMGMEIAVRLDKEATVVDASKANSSRRNDKNRGYPLIVNGSTSSGSAKK